MRTHAVTRKQGEDTCWPLFQARKQLGIVTTLRGDGLLVLNVTVRCSVTCLLDMHPPPITPSHPPAAHLSVILLSFPLGLTVGAKLL